MTDTTATESAEAGPVAEVPSAPELPKRLSPSRMSDFKKCPKAFEFKSILRIPTKPTEAQIKGTLVHAVLEKLFELPRPDRTEDSALGFVPGCWDELRAEEQYHELIAGLDVESFLSDARQLVSNYFSMENPQNFDPDGCETWVRGNIAGQDLIGIIDRLDSAPDREGVTKTFVSDYKTGKVPKPRYRDEAFFAMRVYALMLHQAGTKVDRLRLIYLKEGTREAVLRFEITEDVIRKTEKEVETIVTGIRTAHETGVWPTKTGPLCGWCDFKHLCPEFADKAAPQAYERVSPW